MSDPWQPLRQLTPARIALGRAGGSLPTGALLDFRQAHARARDAVLAPFAPAELARQLGSLGQEVLCLESAAADHAEFLRRPNLGRKLSDASRALLAARPKEWCDLVVIVADGLSSQAAERQAAPLLAALLPLVRQVGWRLGPLLVVTHGRVALQDEIGALLGARLSLMLLGERPGLGAPDSLGAYFTYGPLPGRTDADRNCVSNIRPEGFAPADAAQKLFYLLAQALELGLSGVGLKDETPERIETKVGLALGAGP